MAKILEAEYILSPKVTRAKQKRIKKLLKELKKAAHSRRSRAAYFGETASDGWFDTQETLNAYYHVFYQILTDYGIPYNFLTDRRTIFTYKKKNSPSLDEDTCTQFAYACHQLGVELESSSIPQAKDRVERLNQTLQSRLPIELRLGGITTIEGANEFLNSYFQKRLTSGEKMQTGISIQTARLCALNIIIKQAGINLIPADVFHGTFFTAPIHNF